MGKTKVYSKNDRLAIVNMLYLQGYSQMEMAASLGVSQTQISFDMKDVRAEWRRRLDEPTDAKKAEELARIDNLESEAWNAWRKSQEGVTNTHKRVEKVLRRQEKPESKAAFAKKLKGVMDGTISPEKMVPVKVTKDSRLQSSAGNPAFLDQIAWCIETRVKILGLITDINITQFFNWEEVSAEAIAPEGVDPLEQRILDVQNTVPESK